MSRFFRSWGPVLLLFAGLSLALTFPLVLHLSDHVAGDLGDPLYNIWVMNDNIRKAENGFRNFWDGGIFHPHRNTKLYADTLVALSALAWPIAAVSQNIVLAYNVVFILSFFFCAWGMYLLVVHITGSRTAAVLAGIMFSFFPYNFAHIWHLELLYYAWIPFCLYFLHRYFERPKWPDLFGAGAMFVLQALSCAYYGLYLGIVLVPALMFFIVKSASWRRPSFWLQGAAVAALCAAALLSVFIPYSRTHATMGFARSLADVEANSAQLQHFLAVPPSNLVWGRWTGDWGSQEKQLFPGLVVLVWATAAVVRRRPAKPRRKRSPALWIWDGLNLAIVILAVVVVKTGGFSIRWGFLSFSSHRLGNIALLLSVSVAGRIFLIRASRERLFRSFRPTPLSSSRTVEGQRLYRRFYGILAGASAILALGPQIRLMDRDIFPGPFLALYEWVPGFQGVRVPSRFVVLLMVGLVVLAGMAVAGYEKWDRSLLRRRWVLGLTGLILLIESVTLPVPLVPVATAKTVPAIYDDVRRLPEDAVLVELPMPQPLEPKASEALYMYYSLYHGKRLLNGYSGFTPPAAVIINRAMDRFPTRQSLDFLAELDVDFILVHRLGFRPNEGQVIVEMLRHFEPRVRLVAQRGNDFLYRLAPGIVIRHGASGPYEAVGSRDRWVGWAGRNVIQTRLAFDGNLKTGWSTEGPQRPKDFFLLDLSRVECFSRIELFLNQKPLTFPRAFTLSGSLDGQDWVQIKDFPSYYPVLHADTIEQFEQYKVDLEFDPVSFRFLKINLTTSHPTRSWTIQEIILSVGRGCGAP